MSRPANFEVFGGSEIGEKAEMLRDHLGLISETGFSCPDSIVIADESLSQVGTEGEASAKQLTVFSDQVENQFSSERALAVRSSGDGDGKGNGIYESVFSPVSSGEISAAVQRVLVGFEAPHAVEFRKQSGLSDTRAVLIQPLVGQVLESDGDYSLFGPALSGYGFSSTPSHREGWINIVAGLGGGVSRKGGERVDWTNIECVDLQILQEIREAASLLNDTETATQESLSLAELVAIRAKQEIIEGTFGSSDFRERSKSLPRNSAFANVLEFATGDEFRELGLGIRRDNYVHTEDGYRLELTSLGRAMKHFTPATLLESLAKMEKIAGYPLYVEWAVTTEGAEIKPWIVQLAPLELLSHTEIDRVEFEKKYFSGNEVTGLGVKKSNIIVECDHPSALKHLKVFNADPANAGYILVYPSRLNTSASNHGEQITYKDCDKAAVILEFPDNSHHERSAIEHLLGAASLTGKLFGVIDRNAIGLDELEHDQERWSDSEIADNPHEGLLISRGDFTAVADQNSDRIFVGKEKLTNGHIS